jgi:hypothetical protein
VEQNMIGLDLLGVDKNPCAGCVAGEGFPCTCPCCMKRSAVVGMYDMAPLTRQMDTLKMPTVAIGRAILKAAQATIEEAKKRGANLPGGTARDNCASHLDYYAKKLATATDPTVPFGPEWPDFKKWALQAYIESNAVEEGNAFAKQSWNDMWTDIGTELAKLPVTARNAVISTAASILGIPTWLFVVGGLAVAGGVGFLYIRPFLPSPPRSRA